jgi:hypothetical protein
MTIKDPPPTTSTEPIAASTTTTVTVPPTTIDSKPTTGLNWLRAIVSIVLFLANLVVWITSIISVSLPIAGFRNDTSVYYMTLWKNCTLGAPDHCHDIEYHCSRSRTRFDTTRAFAVLSILISFYCIVSVSIALVQLIRSADIEAAAKAIRSSIYAGLLVLGFSIVSMAMMIVLSVEPICEGDDSLQDDKTWVLGRGAEASAAQACFALVATCFGRIMETRISTSRLGID